MKAKRITPTFFLLVTVFAFSFGAVIGMAADGDDDKAAEKEEKVDDGEDLGDEEREEGVYSASEQGEISELKGKAVIVNGTVKEFTKSKESGHGKLTFSEGKVVVFIPKQYMEKFEEENWDFKSLVDQKIYVAGEVKIYRQSVQVHIARADQIADNRADLDLSKALLPKKPKKPVVKKKEGPAAPGAVWPSKKDLPALELKLDEASVQTIAFYVKGTGMKVKEDPYDLPLDRLVATAAPVIATVEKMENIGPMQVAFPKPDEKSKKRLIKLLDQLAAKYGKWPQDLLLTIDVDFDSRLFKDDPATLVIAVLIESLVTGKEIPPNVILSAEVDAGGGLEPARANRDSFVTNGEIVRAIGEAEGEPARLICAATAPAELNDLALDGDWKALSSATVLTAATVEDALSLVFAEPDSDLGKALAAFDQVQAVIKKNGYSMVKNTHVQQRVIAAGKAWKDNQSAVFYAYYARGRVPRTYSLPRTHKLIRDLHVQMRYNKALKPDDAKDRFREFANQIKEVRTKIDPELSELVRSLGDFGSEASSILTRPRDGKAGERQEKNLKEADDAVLEGLAALAAKISGEEPPEEEKE